MSVEVNGRRYWILIHTRKRNTNKFVFTNITTFTVGYEFVICATNPLVTFNHLILLSLIIFLRHFIYFFASKTFAQNSI